MAEAGQIATCTVVDIEVGNSALSPEDHRRTMARRRDLYPWVLTPDMEHGLTVLHYDGDFDRIAEATGQPTEWVLPAGTAD